MDIVLLSTIAVGLVIIIGTLLFFTRSKSAKTNVANAGEARGRPQPARRAAGVRNARRRMQDGGGEANRNQQQHQEEGDEDEGPQDKGEIADGKIGAKKRAKLEAKAEKKAQREVLEREREDRKKKQEKELLERDKQQEKEAAEELRLEELEKKAREEKERQEYEEYLKLKEQFSVDEVGQEGTEEQDEENLIDTFVDYVKTNKVVILENLAAHFNIKTTAAIDRIQKLLETERLTGVIDDRGKFIYISQEELEAVASFIKQRGRVSITELAENSNRLINLNPSVAEASS